MYQRRTIIWLLITDISLDAGIFSTGNTINLKGESESPTHSVLQGQKAKGNTLW